MLLKSLGTFPLQNAPKYYIPVPFSLKGVSFYLFVKYKLKQNRLIDNMLYVGIIV